VSRANEGLTAGQIQAERAWHHLPDLELHFLEGGADFKMPMGKWGRVRGAYIGVTKPCEDLESCSNKLLTLIRKILEVDLNRRFVLVDILLG
jgi:hypothetical protein